MADDDITWDAPKEDISWEAPVTSEPADHGLSERQKLSPLGKAASPITGYWDQYQHMNKEARDQMSRGFGQIANPDSLIDPKAHGISDVLTGAANVGLGGLNFIASPINAAYRSIIGQPVEDVTGIPREYTEFAAQLATPGIGFGKLPKAPGEIAEVAPKIKTLEGPDLTSPTAVRNRALAEEFDIPLTRGQATEDANALRFEDMAARGAHGDEMQRIAKPAFEDQFEAIQSAGQRVGQTLSRGEQPLNSPADAATSIAEEIGARGAEARASRDAQIAAAERQAAEVAGAAERDVATRQAQAARSGQEIEGRIAGDNPLIENPRQAGEIVNDAAREAAAANRQEFRNLYDEFGRMEGSVPVDEVRGLGTTVRDTLTNRDNPIIIDEATPNAMNAIGMLDRESSGPTLTNRAAPRMPVENGTEIVGVTLQGMDRMRRHLISFYKRAQPGSEDRRAVSSIIHAFDDQIERTIANGLFSGDPRALETLQRARASYSAYRRNFHPQADDGGVGLAMRRIVERNATPEETANMIIGSGKLGNAGLPVRIADRLEQILGPESEAFNSIRQAIWQKASQVRSGAAGEIDAVRSARSIMDFTDTSLARRHFAPDELAAMRRHAEGVRSLQRAIDALPALQKAETARAAEAVERAQAGYQAAFGTEGLTGPQRQVFNRLIEGTAQPEEVAQAMFSIIGGGNPANASRAIQAVERIVGADSPIMGSIRQGVWQKLTQRPAGKDPAGQQKLAQDINEFLNGKGKDVSHELYTAEERALMQRYADAVKKTVIGKYARTNSDTAVASGAAAQRQVHAIGNAIASFFHMGPLGHLGGNWVAKKIGERVGASNRAKDADALRNSVNDVVPPQPPWTQGKPPSAPSTFRPFAVPRQREEDRRNQ